MFIPFEYKADTGETIKIIDTGMHNTDEGPDFSNAKIMVDGIIWAGNIEIHYRSSDWERHGHHVNKSYDNIILHVVEKFDKSCINSEGRHVPTIAIKYNKKLSDKYKALLSEQTYIKCHKSIANLDKEPINIWLGKLAIERLQSKIDVIENYLELCKQSWEEVFKIVLFRNFGFNTNGLPFEMLAKATPLKVLAKYSKSIKQLESLLFGQAGLLPADIGCDYARDLRKEYTYMSKLYNIKPIQTSIWKFMRTRPSNFPTIRIAQLASLINKSQKLFSRIMETGTLNEMEELLRCEVSDYWNTHYTFGKESIKKSKKLGKNACHTIIINTIIPFIFIYGDKKNNYVLKERALNFLEKLPSEKNKITKNWERYGLVPRNAADSQAVLHLLNLYCKKNQCINCHIGNQILSNVPISK